MSRTCKVAGAGLLLALIAGTTSAQPIPGGVPAAPAAPVAPGVVPGAAAAPKVGFFKRMCAGLDECRRKICGTPAGQLLNGATKPASMLTGGVVPSFCPVMPSEKDLQKPGVSGTAAAAQKDALEAKQRREAVRFLGTLDCRYYPDAANALTAALRTDGSECVRYEAALVLGRGCCCTEKTVKALDAAVSGTEIDGNPAERSVRVRCAAAIALERCLSCYTPPPVEVVVPVGPETPPPGGEITPKSGDPLPKPKPLPPGASGTSGTPNELPAASRLPKRETVEHARKTLNEFNAMLAASPPPAMTRTPGVVAGRQSLYHLLRDTANDPVETYSAPGVIQTSASVPAPTSVFAPATPALAPTPAPMMPSTPAPMAPPPASVFSTMAPVMAPPTSTPSTAPALTSVFAPMSVPMLSHAPALPPASMVPAPTSVFAQGSSPAPVMNRAPASTPAPSSVFAPPLAPAPIVNPASMTTSAPTLTSVFAPSSAPMMTPKATSGPAAVLRAPTPQISVFMPEPAQAAAPTQAPVSGSAPGEALNPPTPVQVPVTSDVVPAVMTVDPAVEVSKQVVSAKTAAERISAMRELAKFDWQKNLVIASVLVHAAKNDRDVEVRVEAIRSIVAGKVTHPQVLSAIALLTTDLNESVRDEANKAMEQLK